MALPTSTHSSPVTISPKLTKKKKKEETQKKKLMGLAEGNKDKQAPKAVAG